jgi:hypothetical protein
MHGAMAALDLRARGTYMPITKLRIARGLKANLPLPPNAFEPGRPYFCTDTHELFIGAGLSSPMVSVNASFTADATAVVLNMTVGQNVNAYQAVAVHADGLAYIADAGNTADAGRIVGIAITSATTGNSLTVVQMGEIDNAGFLFTPGVRVYLGTSGALVQTPNAGAFELPLGVALSASKLEAQIGLPILTA